MLPKPSKKIRDAFEPRFDEDCYNDLERDFP